MVGVDTPMRAKSAAMSALMDVCMLTMASLIAFALAGAAPAVFIMVAAAALVDAVLAPRRRA